MRASLQEAAGRTSSLARKLICAPGSRSTTREAHRAAFCAARQRFVAQFPELAKKLTTIPIIMQHTARSRKHTAAGIQIRLPIIAGKQQQQQQAGNNVIQGQQQQQLEAGAAPAGINSETIVKRPQWPSIASGAQPAPQQQLPNWMLDAGLASSLKEAGAPASPPPLVKPQLPVASPSAGAGPCPEMVWRQLRWPATEPGRLAQVACAGAANQQLPYQASASLACLPSGQWASRAQTAHCQSAWLRNLTQRLEAGDSPLSILNELAHRTQPAQGGAWAPFAGGPPASNSQPAALYGADLVQVARIVGRLVDEMVELLNGIADDKQRVSFAREMIQVSFVYLSRSHSSCFSRAERPSPDHVTHRPGQTVNNWLARPSPAGGGPGDKWRRTKRPRCS